MSCLLREGTHSNRVVRHPVLLQLLLQGCTQLIIRVNVRNGGGHTTFTGHQTFLGKPSVHMYNHHGPFTLRKERELGILIQAGFGFGPKEMVRLQEKPNKRLPPLPICPLRPYNHSS